MGNVELNGNAEENKTVSLADIVMQIDDLHTNLRTYRNENYKALMKKELMQKVQTTMFDLNNAMLRLKDLNEAMSE
ncbi:MAG: hypothetical protein IPM56_16125 [Ignavibacteriales bacterium]|nr:MAG: hypothetical protein IPM56_16125 [Ignavibacteriales bacterium]